MIPNTISFSSVSRRSAFSIEFENADAQMCQIRRVGGDLYTGRVRHT